jgi:hypothetical protein
MMLPTLEAESRERNAQALSRPPFGPLQPILDYYYIAEPQQTAAQSCNHKRIVDVWSSEPYAPEGTRYGCSLITKKRGEHAS